MEVHGAAREELAGQLAQLFRATAARSAAGRATAHGVLRQAAVPGLVRRNLTALVLGVEVLVSLLVMTAVGVVSAAGPMVLAVVATVTLLVRYSSGRELVRPGLPRWERVLRDTTVPFCVAACCVVVGLWTTEHLAAAGMITLAGAAVALAAALLRRMIPTAQRVVVIGSAVAVAEASIRWAGSRHVDVVGSFVVADEAPRIPRPRPASDALPEPARSNVQFDADEAVALFPTAPDMVVVVPWEGMTAEDVRRIGWALEGTGIALAVKSVLDGIAPHRLECASYAGASLMHVASSRPRRLPLLAKELFDRGVGLLLLILALPLLALLTVAIRCTSQGPAVFRQVRVGAGGRLFTMYKLRTMVITAEAEKSALADVNEGAGLLFKMQSDPRITPLGRLLRKFSLDELPQLLNVVRGDMSLVGPRPALPDEVAQYSSLERRRLAAKPGLTGLWQVSGRSDLPWDEAVRLDNHYTENWRLVDDAAILVRTFGAVLRSRGAY